MGSSRWRVGSEGVSSIKVLKEMVSLIVDLSYLWFYIFLDQKKAWLLSSSSIEVQHILLKSYPLCVASPDHPSSHCSKLLRHCLHQHYFID